MNALDDELFKHAQHLMTQQRKRLEASGKLQLLPPRTVTKTKSAPLQGSKLLAALKAPAKSSSTKTGVAAEVSSIEELDVGASRPLNNVDRQRIQGHIMQKLQQLLSSKGTSECVWLAVYWVVSPVMASGGGTSSMLTQPAAVDGSSQ
jgi:hypothetical protein